MQLCNISPSYDPQLCRIKYSIQQKMNAIENDRNWEEQKMELKLKFAVLTDNDLLFENGRKEEMFKKLQSRLGKSKEELQKIISAI